MGRANHRLHKGQRSDQHEPRHSGGKENEIQDSGNDHRTAAEMEPAEEQQVEPKRKDRNRQRYAG